MCLSARPDLVLLECGIEGARGLIDEVRGDDAHSRIPLIAIGTAEACHAATQAGAMDWMVPPLVGQLLAHRANTVLRSSRTERELLALRSERPHDETSSEVATIGPAPREHFLQRADALLRSPRQSRSHAAMLVISVEPSDGPAASAVLSACFSTLEKRLHEVLRTRAGQGLGSSAGPPVVLLEGREFTVLLEREERTQEAYKVARRIQQQLEKPLEIAEQKCAIQEWTYRTGRSPGERVARPNTGRATLPVGTNRAP